MWGSINDIIPKIVGYRMENPIEMDDSGIPP
jgi:hypothetical protein